MPSFDSLLLPPDGAKSAIEIRCLSRDGWSEFAAALEAPERAAAAAQKFDGETGKLALLFDAAGELKRVLFGMGEAARIDPFSPSRLVRLLAPGAYRLAGDVGDERLAALAWLLEAYEFDRYRSAPAAQASLVVPRGVDRRAVLSEAESVRLARDLINTPAADLGPEELERAARALARTYKARFRSVSGEALARGFPMIAGVGSSSPRPPRLIDFSWGRTGPRVTLVGKGVCFDTGGLDLKPSAAMLIMKKDMGGAANVLALARMIMDARLKLRLRVLIPAVENAVSGTAFRPGDVFRSRAGLTVEIGNTDAEGRLVLADALALADAEAPDLLIDMATLTGAARVALGPDLPAFFTTDDDFAARLARHAETERDPVWRLPLWRPYEKLLDSRIADINNAAESPFAGSITAALFLARFVAKAKTYAHFDVYAWTPVPKPGRPFGGEAQGIRALFALIRDLR